MSLPEAFENSFKKNKSEEEWTAFKEALGVKPPVSIRIHPHKFKNERPIDEVPWSTNGFYLDERPIFTLDPDFHTGSYYVQEASSQSIDFILRQIASGHKNIKILDLCGAPGGKSTLTATYLNHEGLLVANEVIKTRAYTLRQNIIKEGYDNVVVCNNDPSDFARLGPFFDIIIIDAPCSGEGMFRKDPHSIQEWSPDNVTLCAARQKRILQDVLPCLKEEGYILYSTCTYNEDENIKNIEKYTEIHELESLPIPFDCQWNITSIEGKNAIGYQFYPHKTRGEGFFIALLRKKGRSSIAPLNYPKTSKNLTKPANKESQSLQEFIQSNDNALWIDKVQNYRSLPNNWVQDIVFLSDILRVIHCGIALGTWQKNVFIPDHSLAMSLNVKPIFPTVELPHQEALLYLKRELYDISSPHKGWHLATYNGNGMGFLKNLGHRINNYLPQELRIRMAIESTRHF